MKKSTLSVCVIYSNESVHMERFIREFAPITDEFVAVRAIGALPPDDSEEILTKVCKELGKKLIKGVYLNEKDHADWPHVDNFGAARQMAWELATSDLLMWADLDDILPLPSHAVMEKIKHDSADLYFAPYQQPNAGLVVPRERIVRRGRYKWACAVHEYLTTVQNANINLDTLNTRKRYDDFVIVHLPIKDKTGSLDRNLRILRDIIPKTPVSSQKSIYQFYLHRDLFQQALSEKDAEKAAESIKHGLDVINVGAMHGSVDMRYTALLNINATLDAYPELIHLIDPNATSAYKVRTRILLQAMDVAPERREALGYRVVLEQTHGKWMTALAWCNIMRGVPPPKNPSWTHRAEWYGWLAADVTACTYRMTNMTDKALELEHWLFKNEGFPVSVFHIVKDATAALDTRQKYKSRAANGNGVEYVLLVPEDMSKEGKAMLAPYRQIEVPPDFDPEDYIHDVKGRIRVKVWDDTDCIFYWDHDLQRLDEEKKLPNDKVIDMRPYTPQQQAIDMGLIKE